MTTVYQQIGKFQILRRLGRGGMADVYLAIDTEARRQVALKLLEIGSDPDAQATLAAERHGAILQARLCGIDRHAATVHEYGESDRFFFISMEHVEGDDLSSLVSRGALPPERAIEIATEVCSLLVTAHGLELTVEGEPHHGVIHGDIKPKNVRITPDGRVKVLDFGIAKALSLTRKLTRNDFGSIAYASPERLDSGEVDIHSDLWSLGVVLYEMLAGRQPYTEANTRHLEAIVRSRTAPPALAATCPAALQRVVARALAPRLEDRYPSAADFKADLVALRENRPTIADLQPLPQDPGATRRTIVVPPIPVVTDPDATRRTVPATAAAPGIAAGSSARATAEPLAAHPTPPPAARGKRRLFRRSLRMAILIVLIVTGLRELSAINAAAAFRAALPLKERADMEQVWTEFQDLGERSPLGIGVGHVRQPLRDRLVDFADRILNSYRNDVTTVRERDWEDARRYLARALSVGGSDRAVRARLRYSEGHLHRINGDARQQRRPQEARALYNEAIVAFADAARLNPEWPDPHLGLARVYLYGLEDIENGVDALLAAESAGFRPGNREVALRADAYRRQGERLWREAQALEGLPQEDDVLERAAAADRQAVALYATIVGYGDAALHLTRTERHARIIEERLAYLRAPIDWPW